LLGCTCALFVLALLSSQWGLTRTQSDFNDYLRNNQAVVAQLQELYAQVCNRARHCAIS
jgi:methyl-accepting chemotaxis protein